MQDNLYPLFERNRILKKELLWSLRDYSFSYAQLEYQEYGQGILQGCEIRIQENQLVVGQGIIKYDRFICLMMEEQRISYEPANQMQFLKIKIQIDQSSMDYIAYRLGLALDFNEPQGEGEFELCRFNLRNGARLRDQYKDFADIETEYDTINLIYADWGCLGGNSLSPIVTRYFAETILKGENSQMEDRSLAYLCLSQVGAVPMKVLTAYVRQKTGKAPEGVGSNAKIYKQLCAIIGNSRQKEQKSEGEKRKRHQILVD